MKILTTLALSLVLASGAAYAQQAGATAAPQSGGVSTAPTPRAPTGVTIDQGAGVPGAAASGLAPHPSTPHPHGPDNPQANTPGTQDPSQLGGSGG